jgi:hypothetical protein
LFRGKIEAAATKAHQPISGPPKTTSPRRRVGLKRPAVCRLSEKRCTASARLGAPLLAFQHICRADCRNMTRFPSSRPILAARLYALRSNPQSALRYWAFADDVRFTCGYCLIYPLLQGDKFGADNI